MTTMDLPRSEALAEQRPLRALLYGRASVDRKKRGRSIKDQFADGEAECALRGWTIVDYFEDRDRSASRYATKPREQFDRLVKAVENGEGDVIVYAEASRRDRDLAVYVMLRDLCARTGVLWCYGGRVYDMRNAADRRQTAYDAVQSEGEADSIQYRNSRTTRLEAGRGKPHGPPAFGYARRYDPDDGHLIEQAPHPEDAALVLEAFQRAGRRESLVSIHRWLRGLGKGPATLTGLRRMLTNRAYIGIRVWHGRETKAKWDPIVPEPLFWRVHAIYTDPGRRNHDDSRAKYFLSCVAECGVCGGMVAYYPKGPARKDGTRPLRYGCKENACVTALMEAMDAYVEAMLLKWLGSPAGRAALAPKEDDGTVERLRAQVKVLEQQLKEARSRAATFDETTGMPLLSVASLSALEATHVPMIEAKKKEIRKATAVGDPTIDGLLEAEEIEKRWQALHLEQKRHVVRSTCRVILRKAPGHYRMDSSRVGMIFIGQPEFDQDRQERVPVGG